MQESKQNLAWFETTEPKREFGGELALLMPYVPVGIKETKKKKNGVSRVYFDLLHSFCLNEYALFPPFTIIRT